jgi:hypothetical protein
VNDKTKENEIGVVCSTHGRSEMHAGRWSENVKEMKYFAC